MPIIYIQILDEPINVWRPVPAMEISESVYLLQGFDIYDPEIETWEFAPGTKVTVKERLMEGQMVLVAVRSAEK